MRDWSVIKGMGDLVETGWVVFLCIKGGRDFYSQIIEWW